MDDTLRRRVEEFLDRHHVMTLATTAAGAPWAAAVFYVRDGLRLYFVSSPRSRHAQELASNPHVAAAIQGECRNWVEIEGVQLEGRVAPVGDGELPRVRALYGARFPFLGEAPPAILTALARVRWYELVPEALYLLDNSRGFGNRERLL